MELTTAQAIRAITFALNTEEVDTITFDGEEQFCVTAFTELFTATEDTVYRIIGIDTTEEEAAFIVIDVLPSSPSYGGIFPGHTLMYPIRDSFDEALEDCSILIAKKAKISKSFLKRLWLKIKDWVKGKGFNLSI